MLKSAFSYSEESTLPESVQALFIEMGENPTKSVEYVDEIIRAGLSGRINLSSDFNLNGYCFTIATKNKKFVEPKRMKKLKYLEEDDSNYEETAKSGGVLLNTIECLENSFEEIENDSELLFAINTIKRLQVDFLEEGINLKKLIARSVEGFPQAISKLRDVCQDFELVGEQIKVILSSGKALEACKALSIN